MMKIMKAQDYEHASRVVANFLAAQVLLKPDCILGLATGSTPLGAYQELVKRHKEGELSFAQVTTFNLDEYFGLPPEDERSYHYYMHYHFLDHLDIRQEQTHLPNGMAENLEAEPKRYDGLMHQAGQIDLQLLGIGLNGHIGFNEPGEIINDTHVVDLTETTIESNSRFFQRSEDVPRKAITMGIGTILRAKKIVMMVTGENKAKALKNTILGPITADVPATLLRLHSDFTIVADAEALSLVQDRLDLAEI